MFHDSRLRHSRGWRLRSPDVVTRADELRHTRGHRLGIRGRVSPGSVGLVIFARPIDDDFPMCTPR
jgi:hypothetical protein